MTGSSNHDLVHIQGKPYVLVPLHEYRIMGGTNDNNNNLPDNILDLVHAQPEQAIKIIRKYRGLTQSALADQADISRPYLTEIETGKKPGSIAALKTIAQALAIPAGLLIS